MLRVLALVACLVAIALAQNGFPVVGESRQYPGAGITPQTQGGSFETGPFNSQPVLTGVPYNFEGFTQALTPTQNGIGGAFPGQVIGTGVDPVRGVFRTARNGYGHSGSSATGRSGHGAASGDGFFFADTQYPDRTGLAATQFINKNPFPEQFDSAASLAPAMTLLIALIAAVFAM